MSGRDGCISRGTVITDAGRDYLARHRAKLCGGCGNQPRASKAGFIGVYRAVGKPGFVAIISIESRSRHLGTFPTAVEAAHAFDAAALEFRGPDAVRNFPAAITARELASQAVGGTAQKSAPT